MIIPSGKKIGESTLGEVYLDNQGTFLCVGHSLESLIEAIVTNGRGYIEFKKDDWMNIPYSENPKKDRINPKIFCYRNLQTNKFPGFIEDLRKGHPAYSKLYYENLELPDREL